MSKKSWLCRNDAGGHVICPLTRPRPTKEFGKWYQSDRSGWWRQCFICPNDFKLLFPNLKLKPGEGPRRVEFTGRFCDD